VFLTLLECLMIRDNGRSSTRDRSAVLLPAMDIN
jgi:hypothetical protein